MRSNRSRLLPLTAAVFMIAGIQAASASQLTISGAATLANGVVLPNQAAIEQETGLTLNITVNGDGNGLKDLHARKVDVMMVAAPLKATEAALNAANPGSVSVDGLQFAEVGAVSIHFIVNPKNPVKSLTDAQLREIFSGKITSWKEVGGPDMPIMVVAENPGFGTRTNIEVSFLGDTPVTATARTLPALVQVTKVVEQAPNAIGYGNVGSITGGVSVIPGVTVRQPIGFATHGAPSAEVQSLIQATAKYGAAVK